MFLGRPLGLVLKENKYIHPPYLFIVADQKRQMTTSDGLQVNSLLCRNKQAATNFYLKTEKAILFSNHSLAAGAQHGEFLTKLCQECFALFNPFPLGMHVSNVGCNPLF